MAKGTGESMTTANGKVTDDGQTAAIRDDIDRTRGNMSRTVNAIEERLSPAHPKEQFASVTAGITSDVEEKVAELKESVMGGYHEAKDHLKDDLGRELRGARHMVSDELTHARAAVREATVGRVEHMVHDARESVSDAGTTILGTIKANPIPASLVGLGLGWLIFGGRKSASSARRPRALNSGEYGYGAGFGHAEGRDEGRGGDALFEQPRRLVRQGERAVTQAAHAAGEGVSHLGQRVAEGAGHVLEGAQGALHDAGQSVNHLAHDAGHRVSELAGGARDTAIHYASDLGERGQRVARGAGRQLMRAERSVESTLRQNPLALGAVAVAVGAAIGLALPSSKVEDEWMGEAKERLFDSAQELAGDAIHKAEDAVGQLTAGDADHEKSHKSEKSASSAV